MEDGTTASCNGVDHHHWRTHANASHFGFKGALKLAVEVGDVSRGAAHVEADEFFEACHFGGFNCANNTASRAGENSVFALEEGGVGQSTGGLHEHETAVGVLDVEFTSNLIHIAAQNWGEVSVNNSRVTTANQLHEWGDFMADGNLREADLLRDVRQLLLVLRERVGMHQDDSDGTCAVSVGCFELGFDLVKVRGSFNGAISADALISFQNLIVEQLWFDDFFGEDVRAGLIADFQSVAEAFGDEQKGAVTLAFQQCVGCDCGAHLYCPDLVGWDAGVFGNTHEVANALNGCVFVGLRVFGEDFMGAYFSLRCACNDICEGAAAVDPEVPLAHCHVLSHLDLKSYSVIHLQNVDILSM